MPQFRAWILAFLLACLVALISIRPVVAWDHDTHRRIVQDALQVMPSDLRTLLEANQGALLQGCIAPDVEFHDFYNHVWHVDEPYGGGVPTCLEEIQTIVSLVRQGASASEIAREFGIFSHYVADISCPLHTSSKDSNEDAYHSTFESDVGDHLGEITFQFDGLQFVSYPEARLKGCAQFAYQYYDAIAVAYAATTATTTTETSTTTTTGTTTTTLPTTTTTSVTTSPTTTTRTTTTTTRKTATGKYCGSKKSDVYHYPSCHYVDRIKPENLIWFKNEQEAKNKGYRPCKVCKPPDCGYEDLTEIVPLLYNHAVNAIADLWYTAWTLAQETTQTTTTSETTTGQTLTISTSTSPSAQTESATTSPSETLTATSPTTTTSASYETSPSPSTAAPQATTTETTTFAATTTKTTTETPGALPAIAPELLGIIAAVGVVALILAILVRRKSAPRSIGRGLPAPQIDQLKEIVLICPHCKKKIIEQSMYCPCCGGRVA